jgi:hypothetical protein
VNADQFTDPTSGRSTCIGRGLNRANIASDKDRNVPCTDIFLTDQLNIRGLDHRVSSLDCADESLGFDHSECF